MRANNCTNIVHMYDMYYMKNIRIINIIRLISNWHAFCIYLVSLHSFVNYRFNLTGSVYTREHLRVNNPHQAIYNNYLTGV